MAEAGHKRSEREGSRGHKRSRGRARCVPAAEVEQVPVRDLPVVPREVGDGGWPPWVGHLLPAVGEDPAALRTESPRVGVFTTSADIF